MSRSSSTTSGRSARIASSAALAVGGLARDLDPRLAGQQEAQSLPDDLVVVGDQHPDHRASSVTLCPAGPSSAAASPTATASRSGKQARTVVPSPGALSHGQQAAEFGDPVPHRMQAQAAGLRMPRRGDVEAAAVVG